MKRLFVLLFAAAVLAACNNSAESTDRTKDSLDSIAREKKDNIDSTAEASKDRIDSLNEQKKESVERMDSLNKADTTK
jgi:uncharacterized coiled-coil DUF342 family protein